jgi:hypothetical protein
MSTPSLVMSTVEFIDFLSGQQSEQRRRDPEVKHDRADEEARQIRQ